jgi:hypothetical protein
MAKKGVCQPVVPGIAGLPRHRAAGFRRRCVAQITGAVASSQHREARAEMSAAGLFQFAAPSSSARYSVYWLVLAAFPAAGEPFLERDDFG